MRMTENLGGVTLAEAFAAERRRRGMTLEQVAAIFGVAISTIQRWEENLITPGPDHLQAVQEFINVTKFELAVARMQGELERAGVDLNDARPFPPREP